MDSRWKAADSHFSNGRILVGGFCAERKDSVGIFTGSWRLCFVEAVVQLQWPNGRCLEKCDAIFQSVLDPKETICSDILKSVLVEKVPCSVKIQGPCATDTVEFLFSKKFSLPKLWLIWVLTHLQNRGVLKRGSERSYCCWCLYTAQHHMAHRSVSLGNDA